MTASFLAGAGCLASALIALFFLRFWRDTGDRLFLLFAVAFGVFAVNRLLLTVLDDDSEGRTVLYLVRACAFALIAAAIVDKNRARRGADDLDGVSAGVRGSSPDAGSAAPEQTRP